jgi:hypothetical protein
VIGGVTGMLLLQVVQSGLVVVGISPNWQTIAVGSIMVLAVGLDVWRRRLPSEGAADVSTATSTPGDEGSGPALAEAPTEPPIRLSAG